MPCPRRSLLFVAGCSVLSLVTSCGADPATPQATATPSSSATGATPTAAASVTAAATSTLPPGVDQLLTFTFRDGVVQGLRGTIKVGLGSSLRIVVTSDKAEEIHVHAYDKLVDVPAGGTAQVTFKATIPGRFEVELEKHGLTLITLQVQ